MDQVEQVIASIGFWVVLIYPVAVVASDALRTVADKLAEAADQTAVEWDNQLAAGLKAVQQGLARALELVADLVPRIQARRRGDR